jgi:alkylhydroperoxidase family enzyme
MSKFVVHDRENAPEKSKALLEQSLKSFGMIPNLHGVLAESPQLLEAYQRLGQLFQDTSFDAAELTVVWQSINVEHGCHYCVPAHTAISHRMKVDPAINNALRDETPLASAKLEALRTFTLQVVRDRGAVSAEQLEAFYGAGYSKHHVLEVILGVSQKVVSNYVNHITETPVDAPFQKFTWEKKPTSNQVA